MGCCRRYKPKNNPDLDTYTRHILQPGVANWEAGGPQIVLSESSLQLFF